MNPKLAKVREVGTDQFWILVEEVIQLFDRFRDGPGR